MVMASIIKPPQLSVQWQCMAWFVDRYFGLRVCMVYNYRHSLTIKNVCGRHQHERIFWLTVVMVVPYACCHAGEYVAWCRLRNWEKFPCYTTFIDHWQWQWHDQRILQSFLRDKICLNTWTSLHQHDHHNHMIQTEYRMGSSASMANLYSLYHEIIKNHALDTSLHHVTVYNSR